MTTYKVNLGRTGMLDIEKIEDVGSVKNNIGTKPLKGLWGSREDCTYGWEWWCKAEGEDLWLSKESAEVTVKDSARILRIDSEAALKNVVSEFESHDDEVFVPDCICSVPPQQVRRAVLNNYDDTT